MAGSIWGRRLGTRVLPYRPPVKRWWGMYMNHFQNLLMSAKFDFKMYRFPQDCHKISSGFPGDSSEFTQHSLSIHSGFLGQIPETLLLQGCTWTFYACCFTSFYKRKVWRIVQCIVICCGMSFYAAEEAARTLPRWKRLLRKMLHKQHLKKLLESLPRRRRLLEMLLTRRRSEAARIAAEIAAKEATILAHRRRRE